MATPIRFRDLLALLLLTAAAIAIHGYHLGTEDQAIYLPAIKQHLDPGLYPHDSAFFLLQAWPTLFDELIALTARGTRLPVEAALLLWHVISLFVFLLACLQLARRLFRDEVAQWAGVTLVAALLVLPVAGTLVTITSEYTHPRNLATAALLLAWVAVLDGQARALAWLTVAALLHPQMALFGGFHLAFQAWPLPRRRRAAALPALAIGVGDAWQEVLLTRRHHFPLRWEWYEQLGAVAPIALLGWFARLARRDAATVLERVCVRLALSGGLGVAGAVLISSLPGLERLVRAQGMRTLHLVYILLFLIGGGLLGRNVLRNRLRWILLFTPIAAVMCWHQLRLYPASRHVEWPGLAPRNAWLETFEWIRSSTPRDAWFALDPRYMERPGADHHGFRALAERSMLADSTKDRGVAALFPELAATWREQTRARQGWSGFSADDFRRLRRRFGVDWIVVEGPAPGDFPCPYRNTSLAVCRVE